MLEIMPYRRLIPLLLLLACSCAQPTITPGEAARQGEDPSPLDASSARRLQLASVILLDELDGVNASTRAAAAAELVSLRLPQAREVLIEAIGLERLEVLRAVLDSMLAEPELDTFYGPVLLDLLASAPIDVQPVLAELLARHGQEDVRILPAVSRLASDTSQPPERRVAAIQTIGAFRHAPALAAGELMTILRQADGPDDAVVPTASEQLSRLTGMPGSTTPSQWLAWWKQNRNRPSERWLEDTVDALTKQAARRSKELSEARAARDRMSARLLATYRDFWPLLSIEQQQARLLPLLKDELPAVRVFGLDRLAVQLRDGHDTPGGQEAAAGLLSDPDPSVRAAVAALIPELDPAAIDPAVTSNFLEERDPLVLAAMLPRVAAIQPDLITAEKMTPLLQLDAVRPAAIDAMWVVLSEPTRRSDAMIAAVLPPVRTAYDTEQTPRTGALLTLIGTDEDVQHLLARLDDDDSAWRAAIANALHTRGLHAPLLARATDPAIYPFALAAVDGGTDLTSLQTIGGLTPPDPHAALWMHTLLEAARRTPAADVLLVDDLLASLPAVSPAQRAALLQRVFGSGEAAEGDLASIAKRLAPLVLQTGDPKAVVAMIDQVPAGSIDAELLATKFEAAIRGRLYDEAASVQSAPGAWIDAFERLQVEQPEVADLVRSEIVRRFEDDLDAAMRARLGMATDPMMGGADPGDVPG
jgi:hypothetical protein